MTQDVTIVGSTITTPRLRLRPWRLGDADDALEIYGSPEVARWLSPALGTVRDVDRMRALLDSWIGSPAGPPGRPAGRWAIEEITTGHVVGSCQILPLPPEGDDLELGYQLARKAWGQGYATEAGHALAHYAFTHGEEEVFAVVRPGNAPGEHVARRIGMEWTGETEKYYGLRLQIFRLRKADLDKSSLAPTPVER
ncbi:GNAT family N-acetyltransferase [Nocardioides sp. YIM 152315]|uniref:GNAT family N-acetyltransferase n=1 Tax=Nocardioides sp. YIM 152315 TaxID=3031760 RepID=UPI0023DB54F7|nr:GNAT family N-acetyltransferase [Nocardioides sp. YIM 152315]MDF1604086.1 GNAT family N-acetyltransferase [Nocardioides sp. YIM 152315]